VASRWEDEVNESCMVVVVRQSVIVLSGRAIWRVSAMEKEDSAKDSRE